jgi:hypothetical protein
MKDKEYKFIVLNKQGENIPCFSPAFIGKETDAIKWFLTRDFLEYYKDTILYDVYVCEL